MIFTAFENLIQVGRLVDFSEGFSLIFFVFFLVNVEQTVLNMAMLIQEKHHKNQQARRKGIVETFSYLYLQLN